MSPCAMSVTSMHIPGVRSAVHGVCPCSHCTALAGQEHSLMMGVCSQWVPLLYSRTASEAYTRGSSYGVCSVW